MDPRRREPIAAITGISTLEALRLVLFRGAMGALLNSRYFASVADGSRVEADTVALVPNCGYR